MSNQKFFNYQFTEKKDQENFFVNETNQNAFDFSIIDNFDQNIFLFGPNKSGKSHLINIFLIILHIQYQTLLALFSTPRVLARNVPCAPRFPSQTRRESSP